MKITKKYGGGSSMSSSISTSSSSSSSSSSTEIQSTLFKDMVWKSSHMCMYDPYR